MRTSKSLLAALCAIVLGAHLVRSGSPLLAMGALLLVPLLFVRRRWATWTVGAAFALGTVEWIRALVVLRADRLEAGRPALRMTLILAAVAALTALAAWWTVAPDGSRD